MDYTANTQMLLNLPETDDILDDIYEQDGYLDFTMDTKHKEEREMFMMYSPKYPETTEQKIQQQEQIRMIHLRSHLNQLSEAVKQAQYVTDKTREELKKCQYQIQQHEDERDQLLREIQVKDSEGNRSAILRLQAAYKRACRELETEQELERVIKERLGQAQHELAVAELERGKFILVEDELLQKETQLSNEKIEEAVIRYRKERLLSRQAVMSKMKEQRTREEGLLEAEQRHAKAIEEAERSHERANKYLSKTLAKLKKRQQEEQDRYKEEMTRKMDMLLKLKSDIALNRENIRIIRARDKAAERQTKSAEKEEMDRIAAEGGNPEQILLIKKRKKEMEKRKQQFEAEQRVKKSLVIQKILIEEENMKRRVQRQPYLYTNPEHEKALEVRPIRKKLPKAVLHYITAPDDNETPAEEEQDVGRKKEVPTEGGGEEEDVDEAIFGEELSSEEEESQPVSGKESTLVDIEDGEMQVDLAKPEFEGLWSKEVKPDKPGRDLRQKPVGASKMEQEIFKETLDNIREGIIIKQVAAGKEFSGKPFTSKPSVIHFKDFTVGKSYKKKVLLTNVTYTLNSIRLVDISENLKDFIKISFQPSGQISAGMTCEMTVSFKPMINEALAGEVKFLTQTGPYQIPLICSTKKCDLGLDTDCINFGTSVIGESHKKSFILTNRGALATRFTFSKVSDVELGPPTLTASQEEVQPEETTQAAETEGTKEKSDDLPENNKLMEEEEAVPEEQKQTVMVVEAEQLFSNEEEELAECESASGIEEESFVKQPEEFKKYVGTPQIFTMSETENIADLDGMQVGPLTEGEIGPYSSVLLEIIWKPTIPGPVDTEFILSFSDPHSQPLHIHALASAVDVPVWMDRETVDLKICMFDRLYQDTVVINSRATTSLKVHFDVCKELRNHMEILPKTGFIQAHSQFSAQLKFLPRHSLFQEAARFFDHETGVLEAPMTVIVADQAIPVCFTVQAVVTTTDVEFGVGCIDFGYCTVHESVRQTITVTNKSILPQQFGFVGLPEHMEVEPNDGFGTLLPLETSTVDVIFSPKAAREYKMNLTCRTLINRDFSIPCFGIGVLTPLELSTQVIHFQAVPLYDSAAVALHVINNHIDKNDYTHPVPRIGKGEICPVGPTSFEFKVPQGTPITITPSVGTVLPGQKVKVEVRFAPTLDDDEIRLEALKIIAMMEAEREEKEREEAEKREKESMVSKGKRSRASSKSSIQKSRSKLSVGQTSLQSFSEEDGGSKFDPCKISPDSKEYQAAQSALIRQFEGLFRSVTVPCYVAYGQPSCTGELNYSIFNTLYLEIHCPAVRPPVIVISDNGRRTVDFENVPTGQTSKKQVTIQNISDNYLEFHATLPNTAGPFTMLNALRPLSPGAIHIIILTFTPERGQIYQENLGIKALNSTLLLTLKGQGISPLVHLSVENGVFDMGTVLIGEYVEKPFQIKNWSPIAIDFMIKQDSLIPVHQNKAQNIPQFLGAQETHRTKNYIGPQNNSGRNVFDIIPPTGTVNAGETKQVMVTFAPDHESNLYSDGIRIELFSQEESHFFQLLGQAKTQLMYLEGCDPLTPPVESLAFQPKQVEDEETGQAMMSPPVLLTLQSFVKGEKLEVAMKAIFIGCTRSMAGSQRKSGEFTFDGLAPLLQNGFSVQPQKGTVEADSKKVVEILWMPPQGFNPSIIVEETVILTLKADITEQIPIVIRALVAVK